MSNDRHGPADGLLAAEIHEAVGATGPDVGLSDEEGDDPFANLAAVDGTNVEENREVVHPPGPLQLSSVTVADGATRAFVRLDSAAPRDGEIDAAAVTFRENGIDRSVRVGPADESPVDVVFVFDDAGGMYEEIVGAHVAAGPFIDALSTAGLDARLALVSAKDSIELRQDFTDDRSNFVAAVEDLSGSLGRNDRAHGVESLGVATGHTADAGGRQLSPFRPGAHRVVVSVTDAPALVAGSATDSDTSGSRTLDEPDRFRDALAGVTFLEVADLPTALDGASMAEELFAPTAGGTWFERPGSSAEAMATLLADDVPALLADIDVLTAPSDLDATAARSIELTVDVPDEGPVSTSQRLGEWA